VSPYRMLYHALLPRSDYGCGTAGSHRGHHRARLVPDFRGECKLRRDRNGEKDKGCIIIIVRSGASSPRSGFNWISLGCVGLRTLCMLERGVGGSRACSFWYVLPPPLFLVRKRSVCPRDSDTFMSHPVSAEQTLPPQTEACHL